MTLACANLAESQICYQALSGKKKPLIGPCHIVQIHTGSSRFDVEQVNAILAGTEHARLLTRPGRWRRSQSLLPLLQLATARAVAGSSHAKTHRGRGRLGWHGGHSLCGPAETCLTCCDHRLLWLHRGASHASRGRESTFRRDHTCLPDCKIAAVSLMSRPYGDHARCICRSRAPLLSSHRQWAGYREHAPA